MSSRVIPNDFVSRHEFVKHFLMTTGSKEDNEFRKWVLSVFDQEEEKRPFCPFCGPNHIGYCNVAYTDRCFTCEEAIGAYDCANRGTQMNKED